MAGQSPFAGEQVGLLYHVHPLFCINSTLEIDGQRVTLVALPLIFAQLREAGKAPDGGAARELLDTVRIYNLVPPGAETRYAEALVREYAVFCAREEVPV